MTKYCPNCGQRMLMRHGAQLSPREADLFDLISSHPGGADITLLGWVWAGSEKDHKSQRNLVKTTINHINDKLAATDITITGHGKHPVVYRIENV